MTAAVAMRIGGVEVPLVAMLERPEIERVRPAASAAEPFTFSCEIRSATSARAFFDALKMPQPRHKLTLTRKRRDGSAIVDVVEVDRIDVAIARRGLKRPGDPKEHDPKMVTTNGHDAFLMGFLADVLRAEAEEASS